MQRYCGACVTSTAALVIVMIGAPALGAAATHFTRRPFPVVLAATSVAAAAALAVAVIGATGGHEIGRLAIVDRAGAPFLTAIALVGFLSVLASPRYLDGGRASFFGHRGECVYYEVLLLFWSALLAVPVAASLAEAWLVVEATTAASALLVAFSGTRSALEAGWKYLVLTTAGLTVALLGIVMLIVAGCTGYAAWTLLPTAARRALARAAGRLPRLQQLLQRNATTAACGGCDSCQTTPSDSNVKPIVLHLPRRHGR